MASGKDKGYSLLGDKKSFDAMYESIQRYNETIAEGRSANEERKGLEKKLGKNQSEKGALTKELEALRSQISIIEQKINSNESMGEKLRGDIEKAEQDFSILRDKYEKIASEMEAGRSKYHQTIPSHNSLFPPIISAIDSPKNLLSGGSEKVELSALGDIHGWAPGLLAFLMQNNFAEVEINGDMCNSDSDLSRFFPHPREFEEKGLMIEGQWPDCSPFTPPGAEGSLRGRISSISITPTKKLRERSLILQVGDLNDRGDYSELSFEIARQMVVKSGGRFIVLMGNHEGFLIENDFKTWWKNEQRKKFDSKQPEFVGCQRFPSAGSSDATKQENFTNSVFRSYSAHLAHLLLKK